MPSRRDRAGERDPGLVSSGTAVVSIDGISMKMRLWCGHFCSRLGIIAVLFGVAGLAGCVKSPAGPRPPEESEKALFTDVSAFYCRESRWPRTWDELYNGPAESNYFRDVVITIPRAIIWSLDYKTETGV